MGSFGDTYDNAALDAILGAGFTKPATVYVALYTAAPSDSGGGTEVTGGAYARVAVVNNATNWPAAAAGSKANGTTITFPTATADWGDLTHWAALDASSGGSVICWGSLGAVTTVLSGSTPSFAPNALTILAD